MISPKILGNFRLFDQLDNAQLESLSAIAEKVAFEPGTTVFKENAPAHTLYLLVEGWVDIFINADAQGDCRGLVTMLTSGDLFGWSAIIDPLVYSASAVCASPVEAIQMPGTELRRLIDSDNILRSLIFERTCQMIAERLRSARVQMVKLSVTD